MEFILSLTVIGAFCVVATIVETLIGSTPSFTHRLTHDKRDRLK